MSTQNHNSIRRAYHENLIIMVVEDYMIFSKEVMHALPEHKVVLARTIEEAKTRYEECMPNITFLDIDLPDGDGFKLLDYLRAQDPASYIIILSGSKLQDDVNKAREKGAQGYIIKPFTHSMIKQQIDEYLKLREKNIKMILEETERRRFYTVRNDTTT